MFGNEEKLFKCRLTSGAWTNYTGSMGFGAMFEDGLSVDKLTARQIARIGSSTELVHADTGEQVGPSALHNFIHDKNMQVAEKLQSKKEADKEEEDQRAILIQQEKERKAQEEANLAEARAKAEAAIEEAVIYSREELEAIGSNEGISGLREIGDELGVKGRAISDLIDEIIAKQNQLTAE